MAARNNRTESLALTVTRRAAQAYDIVIACGDGVVYRLDGVGRVFALPHDLAHFVVERRPGVRDGFWGSVLNGAVFDQMTHVSGRRKPKPTDISKALMLESRRRSLALPQHHADALGARA